MTLNDINNNTIYKVSIGPSIARRNDKFLVSNFDGGMKRDRERERQIPPIAHFQIPSIVGWVSATARAKNFI